jgi:hypothetical protein
MNIINKIYKIALVLNLVNPSDEVFEARLFKRREANGERCDELLQSFLKHRNHPLVSNYHD